MASDVRLFGRDGCHLCEDARSVVASVCERAGVPWQEVDVDSDPQLQARYGEWVPVVEVDGQRVGHWRIEAGALAAALGS